jgi:tetratricopeptide (TPR) repeat protein
MRSILLVLTVPVIWAATIASAAADDWADCKLSAPERRVAACTRLINKKDESREKQALAHILRGGAYRNRNDTEKALADYNSAMRLDPKRTSLCRGLIHATKKEYDNAISQLTEAIRLDANDVLAYNSRGNAYSAKGDHDNAIADYTKAIEIDPAFVLALSNRSNGYRIKREYDLAIADASRAIELNPSYAVAYSNRGLAYGGKGDNDRAIADYTKAIEIDPKYARAYDNRGVAYWRKGNKDGAIADYSNAIEADKKYSNAYINRGLARRAKGEIDGAIADYSAAIEINPQYAPTYNHRGNAYVDKGEHELAIADFTKAIGLDPKDLPGAKKANLDGGTVEDHPSIELDPKFADAYNNRGMAYARKGDRTRAIADYTKALEFNPKFIWGYNNRGLAYSSMGAYDKAIADFDKAIEIDGKSAIVYLNRGFAHEKRNDKDLAIADYRNVLELPAPTSTDAQRKEIARERIARLTTPQRAVTRGQSPTSVPAPQRVALVIGNSNYTHAGILTNPNNDARAMATTLRRLGFAEVMERYDATREAMGQALKDFGDLAENAEWAVVFFAGHGIEMNGVNYLIPTDAALKRDTHVSDETMSLTQVQAKVDAASKLGLVILDSCRNNPFLDRMARSAGGTRSIGRGLANVEPEGNVLVAYSAKHGTTASDGAGEHSPFTEALLSNIEEPGLEINFLFRKVRDQVRLKTQRRQEPFLYGSLSSELLYFRPVLTGSTR